MAKTEGGIRSPLATLGLDYRGRVEAALQQAGSIERAETLWVHLLVKTCQAPGNR